MTVAVISDPMNAPIRRVASPEIRRSVNLIKFSSSVLGSLKGWEIQRTAFDRLLLRRFLTDSTWRSNESQHIILTP